MVKKSKRLVPVLQIKERDEKDAAKRLGEAQQGLQGAIKQLEDLNQYRQDYYANLSGGVSAGVTSGVSASVLEKYQLFLSKLNGAVERQEQSVEQYRQHVDAHRKKWVEANARLKSMNDLIDRAKDEESLLLDKQEQKLMDERSQYPKRDG